MGLTFGTNGGDYAFEITIHHIEAVIDGINGRHTGRFNDRHWEFHWFS